MAYLSSNRGIFVVQIERLYHICDKSTQQSVLSGIFNGILDRFDELSLLDN